MLVVSSEGYDEARSEIFQLIAEGVPLEQIYPGFGRQS